MYIITPFCFFGKTDCIWALTDPGQETNRFSPLTRYPDQQYAAEDQR
jgi:hypothetical protein